MRPYTSCANVWRPEGETDGPLEKAERSGDGVAERIGWKGNGYGEAIFPSLNVEEGAVPKWKIHNHRVTDDMGENMVRVPSLRGRIYSG